MDTRLLNNIYKSEEIYNKAKTSKTAFLLVLRYIEASLFLDDKNIYLQKALNIIVNNNDVIMKLLESYINIRLGKYDEADEILKRLKKFKSWLINERSKEYCLLLFFLCQNEFERGHKIRGKRYYSLFSDYKNKFRNNNIFKLLELLLIQSYIEDDDTSSYLIASVAKSGSRSPLFYINIYSMFLNNEINKDLSISKAIRWAIFNGVSKLDNIKIIERVEDYLNDNILNFNLIDIVEFIFNKFQRVETLEILCKIYINQNRIDNTALKVYIEAKKHSDFIKLDQLDYIYLLAAFHNSYEDLEPKVIQKILSEAKDLEPDLHAFVYHLVLTKENMKYMKPINQYKILNFGKMAFEQHLEGKYYNSIYLIMFDENRQNLTLRNYIFEQLFSYEVKILNPNIKYIWIEEEEKNQIDSYAVTSNTLIISASSPNFSIYCLGVKQKDFYEPSENIKITKLLEADFDIYLLFFNKGLVNLELVIALSKAYLNNNQLSNIGISILKTALGYNSLSNKFKYQISETLGRYFANLRQYEAANGYFSIIRPDELRKEVNTAIMSFLQTDDIERALEIYNVKKDLVSTKTKLSICMKAISRKVYQKEISYISFELILKGRYEKEILINVLNHYDGTLDDLIKIKEMMTALNIDTLKFEERILKKAMYIQRFDECIQNIFLDLYENTKSEILNEFINYAIYLILVEQKHINNNLLKCLENEYENNQNPYLKDAVSSVYIMNNMEINNYRAAILYKSVELMEQKQIMFPIFKEYKDKSLEFSYLEKNVPFIYRSLPDKEIYLNYKLNYEEEWHKKKMKYENYGLYMTIVTMFYDELIEYYIEDTSISSVNEKLTFINHCNRQIKSGEYDDYYQINNALICAETLKYSEVEKILELSQSKRSYMKSFGHLL